MQSSLDIRILSVINFKKNNKTNIYKAYHGVGTIEALHKYELNSYYNPLSWYHYYTHLADENWGKERLSNLPKLAQWLSGRAQVQI